MLKVATTYKLVGDSTTHLAKRTRGAQQYTQLQKFNISLILADRSRIINKATPLLHFVALSGEPNGLQSTILGLELEVAC